LIPPAPALHYALATSRPRLSGRFERPNSGGRRPGSGRKKGTPNKVTVEIKELAQKYGPEAIAKLARLATKAESVAAIKELLDRGYGRAVQPIRQHDVRCE
jgi:hypothetical protein